MGDAQVYSSLEGDQLKEFWANLLAGDQDGRNTFLLAHLNLVRHVAVQLHKRLPGQVELDDLVQVGLLGLHNAMYAFDPSRGVKFSTFAPFYVRGAILDHLRQIDWTPRLVRKRVNVIQKAVRTLQQRLARNPTEEELEQFLNLPAKEYQRLRRDGREIAQVSMTRSPSGLSEDAVHQVDIQADHNAPDPTHEAHRRMLREHITRGLSQSERLVILLYYYEQMSMKEIGRSLDLCESRVSQIHKSVLKQLKARLRGQQQEFTPRE